MANQQKKRGSTTPLAATAEKLRKLEVEMAEAMRSIEEKVAQLEAMNEFSQILNSTLDPAIVREKALEATCRLMGCETASLLLVDPLRAELYWETALGDAGRALKNTVRLPIDDRSIAGWVAMTGESQVVNDVERDPRHFKRSGSGFRTRNMVCVALKVRGGVIGVLQAINREKARGAQASGARPLPTFHAEDRRLLEALASQVATAVENSRLYTDVKRSFYDTVEALAEAIEKKDRYTGGHTKRVVLYSMCIAKYLGMSTEELENLRLAAVLHDVGKIGIEDKILKKQAQLDQDEWKVMQTHPQQGYDILGRVETMRDVTAGMRFHHERWDGAGYPLGLRGEEIPLIARIISVADTYDAMVSTRPYRKGLDPRIAFEEISRHRGTQFCPRVVDAFVEAFKRDGMGKRSLATSTDGAGNPTFSLANGD